MVTKDGCLVLRSDNCSCQYNCHYTFFKMRELAIKKKITVAWFYGDSGHGKGTIDSMSSFGCKSPMRERCYCIKRFVVFQC